MLCACRRYTQLVQANAQNRKLLKPGFAGLLLLTRIFYDLNYIDIPGAFAFLSILCRESNLAVVCYPCLPNTKRLLALSLPSLCLPSFSLTTLFSLSLSYMSRAEFFEDNLQPFMTIFNGFLTYENALLEDPDVRSLCWFVCLLVCLFVCLLHRCLSKDNAVLLSLSLCVCVCVCMCVCMFYVCVVCVCVCVFVRVGGDRCRSHSEAASRHLAQHSAVFREIRRRVRAVLTSVRDCCLEHGDKDQPAAEVQQSKLPASISPSFNWYSPNFLCVLCGRLLHVRCSS